MPAIVWTVTPEMAFGQLADAYIAAIRAGVLDIANRRAPEITAWMKSNHVWQNRTGDAEAGLHTEVNQVALDMTEIILAHGDDVSYGIWLEVRFAGRNSIIAPAVDVWGARIWQDVQHMLRS